MSETTISCPHCSQRLRVPPNRNLRVTCPKCQTTWQQDQTVIEHRTVSFTCSKTGGRFKVLFGKRHPDKRFQVLQVGVGDAPALSGQIAHETAAVTAQSFSFEDFDWDGWYCGCCQWGKDEAARFDFIRCGKCKDLVCGRRSYTAKSEEYFKCSDDCGGGGKLTGKPIAAIEGEISNGITPTIGGVDKGRLPGSNTSLPPALTK